MKEIKSVKKSILLGGGFSGIISLIPIINLFNIFFMFWMGIGGIITVYLLKKENQVLKNLDAFLIGALSGSIGGVVFTLFSLAAVFNISEEKMDKIIGLAEKFSLILKEDVSTLFQETNFKMLFLLVLALAFLFAIISGALGGLIGRALWFKSEKNGERGNHGPQ